MVKVRSRSLLSRSDNCSKFGVSRKLNTSGSTFLFSSKKKSEINNPKQRSEKKLFGLTKLTRSQRRPVLQD